MSSAVEICNLALGHLGVGKQIANLETEKSDEAAASRLFYPVAREKVLRDFPWPFATTFLALALVESDPNDEWNYSYRYPPDCLYFRRILSGVRNDTRQSRVPYRIAQDPAGRLIYTDQETAQGEYTVAVTNTLFFSADYVIALSYYLAGLMAPRLSAGDPFKLRDAALKLYHLELSGVQARASNEEQPDEEPESAFIREREGG